MATGEMIAEGPLRCQVVTPERVVIDERVDFVAVPLDDGELGVLPGRAPLVGRLGFGELRSRSHRGEERHFVDGGFVQVRDDVVTVLTSRAVAVTDLDLESARAELARARALPGATADQLREKSRALARARAMVRAAERVA
ncbi:MAG: ATP synthase epsilon chain [Isosphaeraceae bacterium]|jgi:F-type H+-transporting ATPase subunit epsilon|nr:MAG: ATP synthase epsilon chain [Isosphaeraceae bacterium]